MQRERRTEIDSTVPIREQAIQWWVLLNEGTPADADFRAFGDWVVRSPERLEAYLCTLRLSQALKSPRLRWPDTPVATLIEDAKGESAEVSWARSPGSHITGDGFLRQVPAGGRCRMLKRFGLTAVAVAASTAAVMAAVWFLGPQR